MKYCSVIIVTYNSADVIADCLKSVKRSVPSGIEYELIVVDNASSDSTREILHKDFSDVVLIENTENVGFGAGVNRALARASGDILLCLNPDTIVAGSFVPLLLDFFKIHSEASIVGCNIKDMQGNRQVSCWNVPSLRTVA